MVVEWKLLQTNAREYASVKTSTVSKLKELGLSSYAAKAFLGILENQPLSPTNICKSTGIPDSKIYYALKELEDKKLVMVQRGNPSIYKVSRSKQILLGLETEIESDYRAKIESAHKLEKSLEPLVEKNRSRTSDVELAYIVMGFKNILEKMKEAILEARKELVFMSGHRALISGLEEALLEAKNRGVLVRIAISKEMIDSAQFNMKLKQNKSLLCNCNVMIVDSEMLVTAELEDEEHQYGMVARNQSMITLMRKSYDSPGCCC